MVDTQHAERSAYDQLDNFITASRDACVVVDGSTRIVAANVLAQDAFGRSNGPIVGRRLSEVMRDSDLHAAFQAALITEQSAELIYKYTINASRTYDVHIAPINIVNKSHALGVFRDTTKLERLEKVRQQFLSNISHELRTPLTSIMAFVETLEDGAIDDQENNRRFLQVIKRNTERMRDLISDLLELSLIESGNVSISKTIVSPHRLATEVFNSLAAKAKDRNVALVNQIDPSIVVHADPVRLEQMLINLVDNAIKFNRPYGDVTIFYENKAERDCIYVKDSGEGIPQEHIHRIFERLYRTDRARNRDAGGTGLGLAIVKHLAFLHGGEVSVRSTFGESTSFLIELPKK